jgi:hypothetical protein
MMSARMAIDGAVRFPVCVVVRHGGDVPPFSLK